MRCILVLGIFVILATTIGCTPVSPETVVPTEPSIQTKEPTATVEVTDTPESTITPVIIPITGPSMEVGSSFVYVDGSTLLAVPGGEFIMGGDGSDNPEHPVVVDDFWIYSTEVTSQQYAFCVKLGGCTPPDLRIHPRYSYQEYANHPVVGITYDQAAAYCSFMNGRLPTEAEWEKAARGSDGNRYPWGDSDPTCDMANFASCVKKPSFVLRYPQGASPYGALDMAGNVFEWVADWYSADYYQNSPAENPPGPDTGVKRSVRSSSYESTGKDLQSTNRYFEDPVIRRSDLGFRCVVENPNHFAAACDLPAIYDQGTVSESCPTLGIEQFPSCAKKLPTTNVGFNGPSDATINSNVCAPTNDPHVFTCIGPGIVSISASCKVDISGAQNCPDGYDLVNSVCQLKTPSQGACLPGMEFDPAAGCCGLAKSDGSSIDPVCAVGTFFVPGQNICAADPIEGIHTVAQSIQFKSCTGEGGGACVEPEGGCGYRMEWDPSSCSCIEWNGD